MRQQLIPVIQTAFIQAFYELKANKLRSFLSLTGVTIGIFCIIAVFTVLDSLKNNIREEVSTLGNDVLYIGRWPWMDEGGEYKWWEYWRRPSMRLSELKSIQQNVPGAGIATLMLSLNGRSAHYADNEVSGFTTYAVTADFEKLQNIELADGRYLSAAEIDGGMTAAVIGSGLQESLFKGRINPVDKTISLLGKNYRIVGVLKQTGQNAAGINFDNCIILPYHSIASVVDVGSLNYDPSLMIKAKPGVDLNEMKYEVEGALRATRKLRPGEPNNFAINQLSQVTARMEMMFALINSIGAVIGGISLVVGAFGIANIMFVSVKERTRYIGLKKAIGARARFILIEFLLEAMLLCIVGGLVGLLFVWLLSLVLSSAFDFKFVMSLQNALIGILTSAIVGVLAGFIPARKASKLDPVVAIRAV